MAESSWLLLLLLLLWEAVLKLEAVDTGTSVPVTKGTDDNFCPELRSKRYISDGKCSSAHPVLEVVCVDWYDAESAQKKRCVDGDWHRRRVELLCQDGSRRFYHVKVVKSCRRQEVRRGRGKRQRAGRPNKRRQ